MKTSENLIIRECEPQDIDELVKVVNLAYRGGKEFGGWTDESHLLGGTRIEVRGIQEILQNPNEKLLVAILVDENRIAGCVRIQFEQGHSYIGMLSVDPRLQKLGVGKKLLRQAETYSTQNAGYKKFRMSVFDSRDSLIDWYKRQGFVDTGERPSFWPDDPMYGMPKVEKLTFVILEKTIN